jgi:DDT domain
MKHPDILSLVNYYTADKKYQDLGKVSHPSGYPDQLLAPAMKVWAFFRHFDEFIHGPEFSVEEVIACFQYSGPDVLVLIHDLHIALLYLFIDEFESVDKADPNRHKRIASAYIRKHTILAH